MADLADVEDTLVDFIVGILYPNGTAASSALGAMCRVFRGWPLPAGLNADLAAGIVNVTVYPSAAPARRLPTLPIVYSSQTAPSVLSATASANVVTFSGVPTHSHCVGVLIDGVPYSYRPSGSDSASAVAAACAVLINRDRICNLAGAMITIPGAWRVIARVVSNTSSLAEIRRQECEVAISCWCPSPALRDDVARTIDGSIAGMPFLAIPEGTSCRVTYNTTAEYDQAQNALLYRRDLIYTMEYPTVIESSAPALLFGDIKLGAVEMIG